jgi:hypothetical protein
VQYEDHVCHDPQRSGGKQRKQSMSAMAMRDDTAVPAGSM